MVKSYKGVTVPAIQAVHGAEPHEATTILHNATDIIAGQAIFRVEVIKSIIGALSVARGEYGNDKD